MPSRNKPRSPIVRVQVHTKKDGRTTFELTAAKIRALESVSESGRVSDITPFQTARALTNQKLLQARGPEWYITPLGKEVRYKIRLKKYTPRA